jgi:hypothetical protein
MTNPLQAWSEAVFLQLNNNSQLKSQSVGIYSHVPQNSPFPYIHLGKTILGDYSSKTTIGYELISTITIYSRERNNKTLFQLVELVRELIAGRKFTVSAFQLVGVYFINSEINQSNDGVTTSGMVNFRAVLTR